ncbi:MAG: 16S rRNA processing protein RimM [Chloroflexi bacterium]|nr:16S rRNA processing protein RimM [Chloroflexota bacterium]
MSSDDRAQASPAYLIIGEVLRPHGVRGELRVRVLTDYPERIAELESVYLGTDPNARDIKAFGVEAMRMHQDYVLLKLKAVDDRNQADLLRQLMVMIDIAHAVPLEAGEYYLYQLIGVTVQTDAGETLGEIAEVLETGANDVYLVNSPQYGEVLIPATDETIVSTDIERGVIVVKLPNGLLPDK